MMKFLIKSRYNFCSHNKGLKSFWYFLILNLGFQWGRGNKYYERNEKMFSELLLIFVDSNGLLDADNEWN